METAQGFLMNALEAATETGNRHFANELAALIRRRFPLLNREVAQLTNPARFGKVEENEGLAAENEARTYVYGQGAPTSNQGEPAITVKMPGPLPAAKKKDVAEETDSFPEVAAAIAVPQPDGGVKNVLVGDVFDMEDEDIVSLFGSLKSLKEYLASALGADVATNARTGTVVEALKEKLIELYG